jgi:hypothetical protein
MILQRLKIFYSVLLIPTALRMALAPAFSLPLSASSSALKMEAAGSSIKLVMMYQTTWYHISEDSNVCATSAFVESEILTVVVVEMDYMTLYPRR